MKTQCFESISKFYVGDLVVRVWRTEEKLGDETREDMAQLAKELGIHAGDNNKASVLEKFAALPNVSAVEVKDGMGDGIIVYNDGPTDA
jgi:hypothetical protein